MMSNIPSISGYNHDNEGLLVLQDTEYNQEPTILNYIYIYLRTWNGDMLVYAWLDVTPTSKRVSFLTKWMNFKL